MYMLLGSLRSYSTYLSSFSPNSDLEFDHWKDTFMEFESWLIENQFIVSFRNKVHAITLSNKCKVLAFNYERMNYDRLCTRPAANPNFNPYKWGRTSAITFDSRRRYPRCWFRDCSPRLFFLPRPRMFRERSQITLTIVGELQTYRRPV